MAREELPKENLLRDARALVRRVELRVEGLPDHVVIGFRANGAASIYFGEDPALHFTSTGELRRAYISGDLYKAEAASLVRMRRVRTEHEVQLRSRPLEVREQQELLATLTIRLGLLGERLARGEFQVVGEVPAGGGLAQQAKGWLHELGRSPLCVAESPHAR